MLDNILNSVKRGAERVKTRSEEVAQVARLKMEVFQLTRELDGHYARLGRSYHAGADLDLLTEIRQDIRRVEEDIKSRERLIEELGDTPEETPAEAKAPAATQIVQALDKPAEANPESSQPSTGNRPPFTADEFKGEAEPPKHD